jgi:hypothetical protein
MSDAKTERRPQVKRFTVRDSVNFGGKTPMTLSAGDLRSIIERTPGGLLVRYETTDATGKHTKRETFVPDSNIVSMDLETVQEKTPSAEAK